MRNTKDVNVLSVEIQVLFAAFIEHDKILNPGFGIFFFLFGYGICIKGIWDSGLTLIYPPHFEDVQCQSGVNHIYEG